MAGVRQSQKQVIRHNGLEGDKGRWTIYVGTVPMASSVFLSVMENRFPDVPVEK